VVGHYELKPTTPAGDGFVAISDGTALGPGTIDQATTLPIFQFAAATGTRWDLVALRRDWQPPGGSSTVVIIQGGTAMDYPAVGTSASDWNRRPGIMDDQPLYLQEINGTLLGERLDLRVWAGAGGLYAKHDLVRSYINDVGTRIHIDGTDWLRIARTNANPEWVAESTRSIQLTPPDSGWTVVGGLVKTRAQDGLTMVTMACRVTRTSSGGAFSLGASFSSLLAGFIPSDWRPSSVMDMRGVLNDTAAAGRAEPVVRVGTDGTISMRIPSYGGSVTVNAGWVFHLQGSWYL
jgi:hypothetical protein